MTIIFEKNRSNGRGLRDAGLVSTLKLAWIPFCKLNGVKRALKCRNNTNGKEMTVIFVKIDQMVAVCELLSLVRR
jgi:hypothetical protein